MHRLQAAARRAHGVLKIRSKVGQGTVVALILPIIRIVSGQNSNELPPPVRSEAG
jgi:hypothetical protein